MSAIRSTNTRPEMAVRKALHRDGFRFRLHARTLPGKPDLVLSKYRAVVFVNGCFWHMHECSTFRWPKTRGEFWREKLETNRARDRRAIALLSESSWRIAVIWECALRTAASRESSLPFLEHWLLGSAPSLELTELTV